MTASPDDAAASDVPPRADAGLAAPSFPGSPDRRTPEDRSMTQQPPAHDETVRLPADGGNGRPSLEGRRPSAAAAQEARPVPGERPDDAGWPDDTRPVTRDWLLGAPAEAPVPPEAPAEEPGEPTAEATPAVDAAASELPAEAGPEWVTEQIDPVRSEPAAPSTGMTPVPATAADETAGIDGLPYSVDAGGPGAPQDPTGGEPPFGSPGPRWRRPAVLVPLLLLVVLGAGYGVDLLVTSGDVARSTVVAGVDIGGLSPAAAADTLERDLAPRLAADRKVTADDVDATLSPPAAGITLDVDATVDGADDQPLNPWTRLVTLFSDRQVEPVLAVDETALDAQLEALAEQVDRAPVDATIAFDGTTPRLVEPADGRALDRADSADALTGALVSGADPATPVDLPVRISRVHVDAATAQQVLDETVTPALSAPVEVTSDDGGITAEVPVAAIAASLTFTPQESGDLQVGIDPAALQTALGDQLRAFGTPAQDARFE